MKVTPKIGNNFIQCDHMISLLIYHHYCDKIIIVNNHYD